MFELSYEQLVMVSGGNDASLWEKGKEWAKSYWNDVKAENDRIVQTNHDALVFWYHT